MGYLGVVPIIGFCTAFRTIRLVIHENSNQIKIKRHQPLRRHKIKGIIHIPSSVTS